MQMLYNSDSFVVVQIERPSQAEQADAPSTAPVGGYEIVDKFARKGIYIEGALAQRFREGVDKLVQEGPSEEALDDYISGFTGLAQQPVVLH